MKDINLDNTYYVMYHPHGYYYSKIGEPSLLYEHGVYKSTKGELLKLKSDNEHLRDFKILKVDEVRTFKIEEV